MQILMAVCGNLQWHHQNFRNLLILGRQIKWDFVWMRSNIVFASQFEFVLYCSRSLCLSLSLSTHARDLNQICVYATSQINPRGRLFRKSKQNRTKQNKKLKQNKTKHGVDRCSLYLSRQSLSRADFYGFKRRIYYTRHCCVWFVCSFVDFIPTHAAKHDISSILCRLHTIICPFKPMKDTQ